MFKGQRKKSRVELGKVSDLLATNCIHHTLAESARSIWPIPSDYENQTLSVEEDGAATVRLAIYYSRDYFRGVRHGPSLGLIAQEGISNHPGRARIIDTNWIDAETIRGWNANCIRDHGKDCYTHRIEHIEPVEPLWIIDTERGCIVDTSTREKDRGYVTLSYTWGQTKNYQALRSNFQTLRGPGSLYASEIASQIPRTIRDAMGVVRLLGERYLWVDSLCIVQDDPEALRQEPSKMHLIYANSSLTILAEDGDDAEHGLRGLKGISLERSTQQVVSQLSGGEKLVPVKESWEPVFDAPKGYRSRAWTFQEYVFAKRRLVFGKDRLTWQCNCAAWREDLLPDSEADASRAKEDTWGQFKWMEMKIPTLAELSRLIRVFNFKKLTHPQDASKAFAGIQHFLGRFYSGGLTFGLPEFFFDIALFWLGEIHCKRRQVSSSFSGNPSQNGIPSWSWLGWDGEVKFPDDCEHESILSTDGIGFTEPVTVWYAMATPTSTKRKISPQWHKYRKGELENKSSEWRRQEYEITGTCGGGTAYRPKNPPKYIYKHEAQEQPLMFWYPLPSVSEEASTMNSDTESQYLYCETTRAFFYASDDKMLNGSSVAQLQVLRDASGNMVGGLTLYIDHDIKSLSLPKSAPTEPGTNRLEFVAIAKGWTVLFKTCGLNEAKHAWKRDWEVPEKDDDDDDDTRGWKVERAAKDDCYFCLWIKWIDGIAYREGTAIILADMWEKSKELSSIKLILG